MIPAIISAIAAVFKTVATYLAWARDKTMIALGAAQERNKSAEAEASTQEALKEIADERSAIPDVATDPDDLARELRGQKPNSGGSGRKRPF
jgi:uncharacterized membrane protein